MIAMIQIGLIVLVVRKVMKSFVMLTPAENHKMRLVDKVYNVNTPAKDMKFEIGMLFGSKKDFMQAVRSSFMNHGIDIIICMMI